MKPVNKEKKWNYAVVKSIFGGLWIGKTKLKPDNRKIFASLDEVEDIFKNNCSAIEWDEYEFEKEDGEEPELITKPLEKFITIL